MFICTVKKIKMIVCDRKADRDSINWEFLNNVRYRFALGGVVEKVSERTKEEDGVKYELKEYHFVIEKSKLLDLKMYIRCITDYVSFTVEIEEPY